MPELESSLTPVPGLHQSRSPARTPQGCQVGIADRPDTHRAKAIAAFYSSDFTVISEFGHPLESLEKREDRKEMGKETVRYTHTHTHTHTHPGIPFSHEKEGNPAICNNLNETSGHYAK